MYLGCALQSSKRLCPLYKRGFPFFFFPPFFCWLLRFHPRRWLHYMSLKHPKLPLCILFVAPRSLAHTQWPISYLTAVLETHRDNLMKRRWLVTVVFPPPGEWMGTEPGGDFQWIYVHVEVDICVHEVGPVGSYCRLNYVNVTMCVYILWLEPHNLNLLPNH